MGVYLKRQSTSRNNVIVETVSSGELFAPRRNTKPPTLLLCCTGVTHTSSAMTHVTVTATIWKQQDECITRNDVTYMFRHVGQFRPLVWQLQKRCTARAAVQTFIQVVMFMISTTRTLRSPAWWEIKIELKFIKGENDCVNNLCNLLEDQIDNRPNKA